MDEKPNKDTFVQNLEKIAFTLDKTYLDLNRIIEMQGDTSINAVRICPFPEGSMAYSDNIRLVRINQWLYDREEKVIDCFKNVISVFGGSNKTLGLVIRRTPDNVEMYFAIQNTLVGCNETSIGDQELLAASFRGNFPGSKMDAVESAETEKVMQGILQFDKYKSISCLCTVPSDKSEEYISQGIDKLLNGIVPQKDEDSYVIILLAQALDQESIRGILTGYEEIATALTPHLGFQFQQGTNIAETFSEADTLAHGEGISTSIAKMHSFHVKNIGINDINGEPVGYGYSKTRGKTSIFNDTVSKCFTRARSKGTSENVAYTYKSYVVSDLIKKLEKTIERIQVGQASGLWCYASYVLAKDASASKNIANFLRSLAQGDESFTEPTFVNEWSSKNNNGIDAFDEIKKYLQFLLHPVFCFNSNGVAIQVTPTANISTNELAKIFAFPKKSVPGLPVLQSTSFGRNTISVDGNNISGIGLGKIYHMHSEELAPVELDVDSLTMHTFITGSTGSGKSNTVYQLLDKLCGQGKDKHFLVVEPAKGEYKDVFGNDPRVDIYGTNPDITSLLRINPFSFPEGIRVDEHMDRLVSIFNVCWPMYAAMPAVLKDAVERAYVNAGWDLVTSKNEYNSKLFPAFADVLDQIEAVMDESQYSADSKGDYKGALLTRIRSLTNGINGLIFGADELLDAALFDSNVIVDISRVGSPETKSLIMGLLVMKLQEYRMAKRDLTDKLKHVTVLEEAHNLLKRTSTEQSSESSNLIGKSVEMLSNAIAEMRAYGEGFIIADQAPGLLDMAVIRNTNTKIILRLPEYSDRELVGRAAGLNDNQIAELARLKKGVAAVYQNDWVEAVLCQVEKYIKKNENYTYVSPDARISKDDFKAELIKMIASKDLHQLADRSRANTILGANISTRAKCVLLNFTEDKKQEQTAEITYELLGGKAVASEVVQRATFEEQKQYLQNKFPAEMDKMPDKHIHSLLSLLVYWHAYETNRPEVRRLAQEFLQREREYEGKVE